MTDWTRDSLNSGWSREPQSEPQESFQINPLEVQPDTIAEALGNFFLGASIAVLFLISPMVLYQLGLSYEEVGGNPLEKFHPGTWLAVLALLFRLSSRGGWYLVDGLIGNGGFLVFCATTALLLWYAIFVQKIAFTPVLETFGLPILLFFLLIGTKRDLLNGYARFLHFVFIANALLALFEYLTGNRLTPYVAGGVQLGDDDWRATALLGHPLVNAVMTGSYILLLVSRSGGGLRGVARGFVLLLQLAAMVAFGARASLVVMILMLSLVWLKGAKDVLLGRTKIEMVHFAIIAIILPILVGGVVALDEIGFFDRLITRFSEDNGSASARVAMFELFNYFPMRDILFGPSPDLLDTLKGIEGVEAGIESFWVAFILSYGLLVSLLFFVGLFAFCISIYRRTGGYALYVLTFFFVVASTSVSLSAKTPTLGTLLVLIFAMLSFHKDERPDGETAR